MRWLDAGHAVDLVTVAATWGSSPRPPGSLAAVRDDGRLVGSVSGGCIEKQLVEDASTRGEMRVTSHQIADEDARRVGLTCGGRLELVFESLYSSRELAPIIEALDGRRRIVREIDVDARAVELRDATSASDFSWDGRVLSRVFGPGWRVLLIGAGELSRFTAGFARAVDFDVVVCEPREPFRDTFAIDGVNVVDVLPDEAVTEYARDERSAVLALSHDPTLDDLALQEALAARSFHIAALGSLKSHAARRRRLTFLGVDDTSLERISAPAGLDIGSRTAAEIALSIVAELVQARAQCRVSGRAQGASTP